MPDALAALEAPEDAAALRQRFALDPDLVFLNHGSYGACPHEVTAALHAWQREMERNPVVFLGRRSAELLRTARAELAAFVGAQTDDLVFVPNATTGVNVVVRSLDLQPGDEVLGSDLEYGACAAACQFACRQRGADYRSVAVALPFDDDAYIAAMLAAITPRTKLVLVSHIASTTALILPLQRLVRECHGRGVPVLVDGAHAPGQIALDIDAIGADYYTGNCHKWLCAPKGNAFLQARPEHHEKLDATVISWGYVAGTGGHTGFDAYTGRTVLERRLQWQGTRDPCGALAVPAAIDFHRRHLGPGVRERCHAMAIALMDEMASHFGLAAIGRDAHFAQMAPLPVPAVGEAAALREKLYAQHRIEVPVTQYGAHRFVRVSVQGYTTEADLAQLAAVLKRELPVAKD